MPRLAVLLALLLLAAVPAAAPAEVREGPRGAPFYRPPSPLPGTGHGGAIWARRLTGAAALRGGGGNRLLLYRSVGVRGKAVAVSGTVTVPKGRAPRGGWPVISYGHGTTGIADRCAPSRDSASAPAHGLTAYAYPLLRRWLRAGYAVVRTDYEGLGTPGVHPYVVGRSEGRGVVDIVRASRQLDGRLARRYVIAGHSQGGHAALWAASLAPRWTPELRVRGTVALAPVSHLAEQTALLPNFTAPGGLSGLVAMILRGLDVARPDLGVSAGLTQRAAALYPQTLTTCLGQLTSPESFGGLAPADVIRSEAPTGPVTAALAQQDPEDLRIRTPVRVQQGVDDATVFKLFTDPLVADLRRRGAEVSYETYGGVDHGGAVTNARSARDATSYIRGRLR